MARRGIFSRNIAFRVNAADAVDDSVMRLNLDEFCVARSIDNVFIDEDGDVLLSSTIKKMSLNAGMKTLQGILGLAYEPELLADRRPLPCAFVVNYFANGYNADAIVYTTGELFTEEAIRAMISDATARRDRQQTTPTSTAPRGEWSVSEYRTELPAIFVMACDEMLRPRTGAERVLECAAMMNEALSMMRNRHGRRFDHMFASYMTRLLETEWDEEPIYFPCGRVLVANVADAVLMSTVRKRAKEIDRLPSIETALDATDSANVEMTVDSDGRKRQRVD